ncbi:MAG: sigma-70 family RNA polymerase sigma factor, partial [Miltoncostaeaceae bacterium]
MAEYPTPTDDDRRRAVCRAMTSGPALIRFAARYTSRVEDAEDAYQRALEIALRQAPVTEKRGFMAWLHTVLKHEALALGKAHRREGPTADDDLSATLDAEPHSDPPPHAAFEWRQRYRALQDALASLSESQRICVMLQSAGASYRTIEEITGFSRRKVERSVLEGRRSLHRWELDLAQGDVCERLTDAIESVAGGTATDREARSVRRHVRHCPPCAALLRRRRQSHDWLGALVPVALVAVEAEQGLEPDPSPMFAYWERAMGTAAFRMSQLAQLTTELYAAATTKAGIGAATVAIAGAATSPLAIDAIRSESAARPSSNTALAAPPSPVTGSARRLSEGLALASPGVQSARPPSPAAEQVPSRPSARRPSARPKRAAPARTPAREPASVETPAPVGPSSPAPTPPPGASTSR